MEWREVDGDMMRERARVVTQKKREQDDTVYFNKHTLVF